MTSENKNQLNMSPPENGSKNSTNNSAAYCEIFLKFEALFDKRI